MLENALDGELVRRIAAGEPDARQAEATLCRRFAPRIRLYGLRHLRSEERALDLVQSVLVALLEAARAGRIEQLATVERFVLGVCRNTALRAYTVERRAQPMDDGELIRLMGGSMPGERVDKSALVLCLAKLDERARTVVVKSFLEEHSAEDIAQTLDLTPSNVRVVRHRALAALRRCLDGTPLDARAVEAP